MKRRFAYSTALTIGAVLIFSTIAAFAADAPPAIDPNAPVAIVDGTPIKRSDFDKAIAAYMNNVASSLGGAHTSGENGMKANDSVKKEVLEQLIDREVLFNEIEKKNYEGMDKLAQEEFDRAKA